MIPVEKQVCTLKQAQRLKELNVPQQHVLYQWLFPKKEEMISTTTGVYHYMQARDIIAENTGDEFNNESAAAFTLSEIGYMLPDNCYSVHYPDGWEARYCGIMNPPYACYHKTEVEAKAQLLIKLLEEKVIIVDQLNKLNLFS